MKNNLTKHFARLGMTLLLCMLAWISVWAEDEVVVLPEGLVPEEFVLVYQQEGTLCTGAANIAVDGNDVYIQGFSRYVPDAWVKGTKEGNTVTFPQMQFLSPMGLAGDLYAFCGGDAVFTYDEETGSYSAQGRIYGMLGSQTIDFDYTDLVLKKAVEKAVTPATPTITSIGKIVGEHVVNFAIPLLDTNGDVLVSSKLSYQFIVETEEGVSPLTFGADVYEDLEQDMTVIPYGFFISSYFYTSRVYFIMPEYYTFKKLGIQTIYTGGGEEHKSEVFWFDIEPEPHPVIAPKGLVTEGYTFSAVVQQGADPGAKTRAVENAHIFYTQLGFNGNDVYIKGVSQLTTDMWIKATKNEAGQYVIPANQFIGETYYLQDTQYYITALDDDMNAVDIVLDYDEQNATFTTSQTIAVHGSLIYWSPYDVYSNVSLTKFVEVAATPAAPEVMELRLKNSTPRASFQIPNVDTNGQALNVDKLFYTVWIEKGGKQMPFVFEYSLYESEFEEDVTEVPFAHDKYDVKYGGKQIYFRGKKNEATSWSKVGIQSIYYGAGECRKSDICWAANPNYIPDLVTPPEGVVVEEYSMSYLIGRTQKTYETINVAIDGNDVYFQGLTTLNSLKKAWVKGTMDGNLVTFPQNQYVGTYMGVGCYLFTNGDAVFTYDAETSSFSYKGDIIGTFMGSSSLPYSDFVLKKAIDEPTTPATPQISDIGVNKMLGYYMKYTVPLADINGNGLVSSKLSIQFYVVNGQDTIPLTFKSKYYSQLEEDLSVIPYTSLGTGLLSKDAIVIEMMEFFTYSKVGVQSIYTGGGVENRSEIFWFDIEPRTLPVLVPEDLQTDTYLFTSHKELFNPENEGGGKVRARGKEALFNDYVKVGIDGNDVYFFDLIYTAPEAVVKATKNEAGQYVVPANQLIGETFNFGDDKHYYITGLDDYSSPVDIVFDYDEEKSRFTTNQEIYIRQSEKNWLPCWIFSQVSFSKVIEMAATPADPETPWIDFDSYYPSAYFGIPALDTDGNGVVLENLYYTVWIEKDGEQMPYVFKSSLYSEDFEEDVTEVPYTHYVYDIEYGGSRIFFEENNEELSTWAKVGVQSIYYGAGECHKSKISWADNPTYVPTSITTAKTADSTDDSIYDMQGRRVSTPVKGLYIKNNKKVFIK